METVASQTAFHPYKVMSESRSTLQLQPGMSQKSAVFVLRLMPIVMLILGIVLYMVQKEFLFLPVFVGIALLEGFIFSFIKIPAALSMDSIGFTLQTLSIKGGSERYYLWNDVDVVRYRMVTVKNTTTLTYDAILKTGKRISFLSFPNYQSKQINLSEINAVLTRISGKEVREK